MTIEKIIEIYNDHDRISGLLLCGNSEDDSLFNSETIEAMNNINAILRKYQRIEQILKDIPYGGEATVRRIQEVIDNGNDD